VSALLRRWQTELGDAYVVSLVRVLLGLMLTWSAFRDAVELGGGAYSGDAFRLPIVPDTLVPSLGIALGLVAVEAVLGLLVIAGRGARGALFASGVVGLFLLCCDRLRYHNNRYALLLFAFLLAFAPCDRAFVLGRNSATATRQGALWAQRLAQLQLAIIYLASGGSKLLDADWRSGLVIGDRLARSTSLAVSKGVPIELMHVLSGPRLAEGLSKIAIATELFLAVALFVPRARFFALWWGVMFHLTIEVTSKVELFTWLTLSMYALFARPALGERSLLCDESSALGRFVMRAVLRLDWLRRFEVRAGGRSTDGRAFVVVLRDGSQATGLVAAANLARALPLLFPLSVPLFLVALPRRALGLGTRAA
jgi:hypothetical protein